MWGKPPTVAYDCDMRETEQPAFALQKLDNIDPSKIWVIRNTIKSDDYQRQNKIKYLNWYFFSIIPPAGGMISPQQISSVWIVLNVLIVSS